MGAVEHRTVCNRDCPDACGLIATVEDGKLVALGGDPAHPVTKGFLCYRTSRFPEMQNGPLRLTEPLLRRNGVLAPATWEEALGFVADRLLAIRKESGPAAILHYRSGGSLGIVKSVVDLFFEALGPVSVKRGDICSGAGDAAQVIDFGREEAHDVFDVANARNVILWGKNPAVSNVHVQPVLREAKRKGARVLLVDPIRHKSEKLADRVILPRPGGDFDLAMGVAARLFEAGGIDSAAPSYCDHFDEFRALALSRTAAAWAGAAGVAPDDVEALAAALAARPCSIQVGWGMGRRMNGAGIVRALDALGAVTGNLGIPGGGVFFSTVRRAPFDFSFLSKSYPRTFPEPLLGEAILAAEDPPVRAVWVTAGNPVAMLPDSATVARALETRELLVVVDPFLTDTARRATVVFPTTTLVEDDDLLGSYGHHFLGASTPVVAPPPGVLTDLEIVQALAQVIDEKTGARDEEKISLKVRGTAREWKKRLLSRVEAAGVTLEQLERASVRHPFAEDNPLRRSQVRDAIGQGEPDPHVACRAARRARVSALALFELDRAVAELAVGDPRAGPHPRDVPPVRRARLRRRRSGPPRERDRLDPRATAVRPGATTGRRDRPEGRQLRPRELRERARESSPDRRRRGRGVPRLPGPLREGLRLLEAAMAPDVVGERLLRRVLPDTERVERFVNEDRRRLAPVLAGDSGEDARAHADERVPGRRPGRDSPPLRARPVAALHEPQPHEVRRRAPLPVREAASRRPPREVVQLLEHRTARLRAEALDRERAGRPEEARERPRGHDALGE